MSNHDADWGVEHIERLLALAESLRALRFAVYHHEWYELAMGSWKLTAGTRHRSYEFVWDGRDGVISVRGPFHAGQGSASVSPSVVDEKLGVPPSLEPFQYVEHFFSQAQTPNQSLERTADRRENSVPMTSTLNREAELAVVNGHSACSR